jgi:hypothetical protein
MRQVVKNIPNNETYLLYQCGTELPRSEVLALPAAKVFEVPLRAVSAPDTTVLGFMVSDWSWSVKRRSMRCYSRDEGRRPPSSMQSPRVSWHTLQEALGVEDRVAYASHYSVGTCMQQMVHGEQLRCLCKQLNAVPHFADCKRVSMPCGDSRLQLRDAACCSNHTPPAHVRADCQGGQAALDPTAPPADLALLQAQLAGVDAVFTFSPSDNPQTISFT